MGYDSRNRLTSFNRAGAETSYTYDANSNRLTAIDKTTSDIDLDGDFDNADFSKTTHQNLNIEATSNRLLGFTQTLTHVRGTRTVSTANANVAYTVDAAGNLTSDGLRTFEYDAANRLSSARILKDGEAASIRYLHNALGQRVFKGEPTASQTLPSEADLGQGFIDWLKSNFRWMFTQAQANTSIGTAYRRAIYWFTKAYRAEDGSAAYLLGRVFELRGLRGDKRNAVYYFLEALVSASVTPDERRDAFERLDALLFGGK